MLFIFFFCSHFLDDKCCTNATLHFSIKSKKNVLQNIKKTWKLASFWLLENGEIRLSIQFFARDLKTLTDYKEEIYILNNLGYILINFELFNDV